MLFTTLTHHSFIYIAVRIYLFSIRLFILENNSYSVPLTLVKFHLDIGIVLYHLVPLWPFIIYMICLFLPY